MKLPNRDTLIISLAWLAALRERAMAAHMRSTACDVPRAGCWEGLSLPRAHDPRSRAVAAAVVVGALLTGCTTPPQEYHDVAQHPFELHESVQTLILAGRPPAQLPGVAAAFAAARPNNGSSFVIAADPATGRRLQTAILETGVAGRDISLVNAAAPERIERRDRIAGVAGCFGAPKPMMGLTAIDDGYGHDNANSAMLGCAVRRNIAAMTDDPRTLAIPEAAGPHEGVRSADVYDKWSKGQNTGAATLLPTPRTATTGVDTGN